MHKMKRMRSGRGGGRSSSKTEKRSSMPNQFPLFLPLFPCSAYKIDVDEVKSRRNSACRRSCSSTRYFDKKSAIVSDDLALEPTPGQNAPIWDDVWYMPLAIWIMQRTLVPQTNMVFINTVGNVPMLKKRKTGYDIWIYLICRSG